MDAPVRVKTENEDDVMDAPVRVKAENEGDVMELDQAQPKVEKPVAPWSNDAEREVFWFRHRLQIISKEAMKQGLSPTSAMEIKDYLTKLSTLPWEPHVYKKTKIRKAVELVSEPASIFGDQITSRAKELIRRWADGRFSPQPFDDAEDELYDSEYDTSDSEEDVPSRSLTATTGSSGEVVNTCITRLLRGIIITKGKSGTKQYTLDPRYPKRPADVFGHNGLTVGDWWPFQSFTLRDGAHGAKMGGIYGRIQYGAFSVVISGGTYDDNDFDSGDRVLYSGSKGGDEEDATKSAPLTTATQALIMSTKHRKPVRVLRSARGTSRWAPTAGIRYDGLYSVESYTIKTDREGKKFYQFVLVRRPDQPPIDRTRPTAVEVHALDRIREMV